MIKKLNGLKAKRGFTLVELIAVVAIIAVLAAILVPVMMGYVERANIVSADNTAADLADMLNIYFVTRDAQGDGMKLGEGSTATYFLTAQGGKWEITSDGTFNAGSFFNSSPAWSGGTSKAIGVGETNLTTAEDKLALHLAESFPPATATAWVYLVGGKCKYCWYSRGSVSGSVPTKVAFDSGNYAWNGRTNGINGDGEIVGTYPVLLMSS